MGRRRRRRRRRRGRRRRRRRRRRPAPPPKPVQVKKAPAPDPKSQGGTTPPQTSQVSSVSKTQASSKVRMDPMNISRGVQRQSIAPTTVRLEGKAMENAIDVFGGIDKEYGAFEKPPMTKVPNLDADVSWGHNDLPAILMDWAEYSEQDEKDRFHHYKIMEWIPAKDGDEGVFRKEISGNMERESKAAIKARVKQQVMDMVIDKYDALQIPSALINQEIQAQRSRMFQNIGGQPDQNINLNEILPDQMFSEMAEKRVKLALILNEYIQDYKVTADGQIVRETIEELASTYEQPEDVVNWYYSNQEQLASIESQVVEDQLVDRFLEKAIIKEIPCTYKEVLSLAQQNG